jgi:tetratricopeptide (TPR) repeat protein
MENMQFNELLKSPHLLASMPIEELETITKNYPWFSLAHSYLAKAYQEKNSHKTSGQIALASTLHSNRTWLYGFLKEPILRKQEPTEVVENLPIETVAEVIEVPTAKEISPSTSLSQLAESMLDEAVSIEVRENKREEEIEVRDGKTGEEKVRTEIREDERGEEEESIELREDKKGEEEVRELDFLDKSILATAVSSSIFLEVSEADEEQDAAQDSTKDVAQGPAEDGESDALFTWLRSVSDSAESDEERQEGIREVKKGEEQLSIEVKEDKRSEEKARQLNEAVQPTIDLIEKFIAAEPRITPGKVEQYTGVSFAKDSLEENFDWVTETMAKLYAAQGKIDRARKAYKRLIQLHPEKKIHFENQLKALNQRK